MVTPSLTFVAENCRNQIEVSWSLGVGNVGFVNSPFTGYTFPDPSATNFNLTLQGIVSMVGNVCFVNSSFTGYAFPDHSATACNSDLSTRL
ncbi:hypothetical protein BCR33DRAFT_713116 [Rhizoclosmatium globosum]|uniref:Uncharacterized protein n=1 Tax=Rhizoclosmatium globosum TaxID=329046 RepID=A0A1Y2CTR6_9FUNG|nr:hypothetical protein BCR33DRAFT_713116 [Rhizoclosmatium globosum]|eukprot:ORY50286.1 hypothetical protein BCR33DRAFT_713116 [Rhizoclosmatium globosum]